MNWRQKLWKKYEDNFWVIVIILCLIIVAMLVIKIVHAEVVGIVNIIQGG
jgi:hypothetical protein